MTRSMDHQDMDLIEAGPLRSCSKGGRKVYMLFKSQIGEDVEPIFLLYDQDGRRLEEMDHVLTQPNDLRYPDVKNLAVMKETIIFITPPQPNIEMIMKNGWLIKLAVKRRSCGVESSKKIKFNYVPDDFYDPCIFCKLQPDGDMGKAVLPDHIKPFRPSIKKRRILEILKDKDPNLPLISENLLKKLVPKFRYCKIPCLDDSLSNGLPTPGKSMTYNAETSCHKVWGNLRLKPISSMPKIQTSQASNKINAGNDIGFEAYRISSATIQDLIDNQRNSLNNLPNLIPIKKTPQQLRSRSTEVSFKAFLEQQITEPHIYDNLQLTTNKKMEKSHHCPYLWENTNDSLGNQRPHIKDAKKRSVIRVTTTRPDKTTNYVAKNFVSKNNPQFDQLSSGIPDTASQHLGKGNTRNSSDKLPQHKIDAILTSLENSQSLQGFVNSHDPMQKKKAPECVTSPNQMLANQQILSYQSEMDNLNNLDVLDMIFQPLPPAINDKLKTNYNYASIGNREMY